MLISIALFLMLQLIGEALSYGFGWPIPGPVLGMIFLLIGFLIKDNLIERVRLTASVLLAHLALLFVPAGVGIVRHWDRISAEYSCCGYRHHHGRYGIGYSVERKTFRSR